MKREELTPIDLECNMGPDVNGVVQREPWKAYDIDEVNQLLDKKDAQIASLKAQIAEAKELSIELQKRNKAIADNAISNVESYKSKRDAEIESLKASHYAEMVDAGMRERRLNRALWLARAERADDRARIFYFSDLESVLDIDGFSYDSKKKKGCKKLTARLWRIIWLGVERKCRDKAEEYR